jgi:hypothetical protein
VRRRPRRGRGHLRGQLVEPAQHLLQLGEFVGETAVKLVLPHDARAGKLVGGLAVVELRVGLDPELGGQREHPVVGVADPLRAEFHRQPAQLLGEDAATDAGVGLQDQRGQPGLQDRAGRRQARQSRADDEYICFAG